MTDEGRKLEPPFGLDMPFDEALKRFVQTKPEEVELPKGKNPKSAKRLSALSSEGPKPPKEKRRH